MQDSVKERLKSFLKYINIGQAAFEKSVGFSNGYVNNIRKSIQPDKVQKIALIYPQLNVGWLLTGDGKMIKEDGVNISGNRNVANTGTVGGNIVTGSQINNATPKELENEIIRLKELINEKDVQLKLKDEIIQLLRAQLPKTE